MKNKWLIHLLLPISILCGCYDSNEVLCLKYIKTEKIELAAFFSSSPFSITSEYIVAVDPVGKKIDTLAVVQNFQDINLIDSIISIKFHGGPYNYDENISIKDSVFGFPITVDTSGVYDFDKSLQGFRFELPWKFE